VSQKKAWAAREKLAPQETLAAFGRFLENVCDDRYSYRSEESGGYVFTQTGLLRQPVEGVCDPNFRKSRFEAADWILSRINLPSDQRPCNNQQHDYAIITIGPGVSRAVRKCIGRLIAVLKPEIHPEFPSPSDSESSSSLRGNEETCSYESAQRKS
jgi:hypothetical protein